MRIRDVFASKGGRRYHSHQYCRAFRVGQGFWEFKADEWVPGMPTAYLTGGYGLELIDISEAAGRKLRPCTRCRPIRTTGEPETFGHVPYFYDGVDNCMRCQVRDLIEPEIRYLAPWPCATAVVLGLADPT